MTSVELGEDWEHTELLHKKFREFQVDLGAGKGSVDSVDQYAERCVQLRAPASPQSGLPCV